MGTDCRVYLPSDTRVQHVAEVIGILLGLPPKKTPLGERGSSFYTSVDGAKVETTSVPEMCVIVVKPTDLAPSGDSWYYHFDARGPWSTMPLLSSRALAISVAVGDRVAQFFGGIVDFNDCDSIEGDRVYRRPRPRNNPGDGEGVDGEWEAFQQAIFDIKPLTQEDIVSYTNLSAYRR